MKIFLSYSTKDEKIVRRVSTLMPSEVFTWIDHKAIGGGSILNNKIKKGINESDIINGDRLNKNRKKIDNIIYFNDFIIIYR